MDRRTGIKIKSQQDKRSQNEVSNHLRTEIRKSTTKRYDGMKESPKEKNTMERTDEDTKERKNPTTEFKNRAHEVERGTTSSVRLCLGRETETIMQ